MNPSPQEYFRPQNAVAIASLVVVNIIWWMIMIAAIGLGATNMSHCPVQPKIPIYLIVLGTVSIVSFALTYTKSTWKGGAVFILSSACVGLLHLFTFCWFITGTVWVYSVYPPNYTAGQPSYCHKIPFLFAFVFTTVVWAFVVLMFFCGCCFGAVTCCTTVEARHRLIPNRNTFYGGTGNFREPIVSDV
ncbi:transmembrane protein 272-like [Trachinotus anak]|uniref:transmembrane protein 272-like n=1 Tax=Trachinotus anak TaxID=443729 RepID=UPI0039F1B32B